MTTTPSQALLDAALASIQRGWRLVALHSIRPGGCTCGHTDCDSPGKHPRWHEQLLPSGVKSASSDEATIRAWWGLWPDANIGLATGAGSGVWALDVDPAHGGAVSLEALMLAHGPLPDTPIAVTGGGGQHWLFRHPGAPIRNRVRFAPGLDTRGDDGYIVLAPSLHASGRCYDWQISPDDAPLADAPAWLLELLAKPLSRPAPAGSAAQPTAALPANGTHAPLPPRTLTYLSFGASVGSRNAELYAAAQQHQAAGYSEAEAEQILLPRARSDGLGDHEARKTIASAYRSGIRAPAAVPTAPTAPSGGQGGAPPPTGAAGAGSSAGAPSAGPPPNSSIKQSALIAQQLRQLGYTFRLNLCSDTVEVNGDPMDKVVAARIRSDARDAGIRPLGAVEDTILVEASNDSYHPVKDYLTGLTWDGQRRIAALAAALVGSDPPVIYPDGRSVSLIHVYLWRWLIGAVAKALDAKQNLMLVIAGPQGIGKSQLARWLCGSLPFIEAPINVADKDTDARLMSHFLWEVSELDATTRKSDVSALKAFITKKVVTVRRPYDQFDTVKPALASLIGTVNLGGGFLSDETGNRRFMIATVEAIDWDYIKLDVDQVWAEAVAAYGRGESWKLWGPELALQTQQNKLHETESLMQGWIEKYFDYGHAAANTRMTAAEIVDHLRTRDVRPSGPDRAIAMEIARACARLGVRQVRGTGNYRGYEGIAPK